MTMRLIATDLDGTLLNSAGTVTQRTRAALDAARARGIHIVPVTARQPISLRRIAASAGFDGRALCGNGAYATHLSDRRMLFAEELPAETVRTLAEALRASIPGFLFVSVRDGGERFIAEHGYAAFAQLSDHGRDPRTIGGVDFDEIVSAPTLKLIVRHPKLTTSVLFDCLQSLGLAGFEATLSGAPFLEVMAEGVTKASGLARLCEYLGVPREEVVAFGDALNDVKMLRWAGHGVALSNTEQVVKDAANEVAESNDADGVAQVIERMLR